MWMSLCKNIFLFEPSLGDWKQKLKYVELHKHCSSIATVGSILLSDHDQFIWAAVHTFLCIHIFSYACLRFKGFLLTHLLLACLLCCFSDGTSVRLNWAFAVHKDSNVLPYIEIMMQHHFFLVFEIRVACPTGIIQGWNVMYNQELLLLYCMVHFSN
jgi:hypothetical protein